MSLINKSTCCGVLNANISLPDVSFTVSVDKFRYVVITDDARFWYNLMLFRSKSDIATIKTRSL